MGISASFVSLSLNITINSRGADPWSILYEPCPDVKQLSPGSSLGWTWDQYR
jgi:hypothetical protein